MSELKTLASKLGFRAIANNWNEFVNEPWVEPLLLREQKEKEKHNLDTRMREAKIGSFKPMAEFDWNWPEFIDREQIEDLFSLDFVKEGANVTLVGTEGLGKTMVIQNLAHTAVLRGHHALFIKTSKVLNDLLECDGKRSRKTILNRLCKTDVLCLDEIGYMSYDNRYADLLYEVISERYNNQKSTVISTNREFNKWSEIFPTAACVVTLVDKLVHKSEIVVVKGQSYRLREAKMREEQKAKSRKSKRKNAK